MYKFSKRSKEKIESCHPYLQAIVFEAIKIIDFSVIFGHRNAASQFDLYKKGRLLQNNKWIVVDDKKIVTNCDGFKRKSKHNIKPAKAIDLAPYPIDWENINRFFFLGGVIMTIAHKKKIPLRWGNDFNMNMDFKDDEFKDLPHFELI